MKAVEQVLDVYERFAEAQAPLSPAELARRLDMAPSTCFNLVRTFEQRGFIHAVGSRRALYPTKRMLVLAQEIAKHSPVGSDMLRSLTALRDATGETVVLASRTRDRVTYLEVLEAPHRIRYSAQVGETRPVQVNSMGKALIALMPREEREALVRSLSYERLTDRTLASAETFLADIERSIARGWFLNDGESVEDVIAVAVPIVVHDSAYAVTLAGPRHRLEDRIEERAGQVRAACEWILSVAERRSPAQNGSAEGGRDDEVEKPPPPRAHPARARPGGTGAGRRRGDVAARR